MKNLKLNLNAFMVFLSFILIMSGCDKDVGLKISDPIVDRPGGRVKFGEIASLSVRVENPKGLKLEYEWKAEKGTIVKSQLSPTIAQYSAPNMPGEDLVILKVKSEGREIFVSNPAKIIVTLTNRLPILPPTLLQGEVTITNPADGSIHQGQEIWVEVRYSNVLRHLYIWVLTYPHDTRKYYPTGSTPLNVRGPTSSWRQKIDLGPYGQIEQRQLFDIAVILANRDANRLLSQTLKKWRNKQQDFPGLEEGELPEGMMEKDSVTIIREK